MELKFVDEVIIGVPLKINEKMLKHFQIKIVVHGKYKLLQYENPQDDPYDIPKKLGIFKVVDSKFEFNSDNLIQRIIDNRQHYVKSIQKKTEKAAKYEMSKDYTIQEK